MHRILTTKTLEDITNGIVNEALPDQRDSIPQEAVQAGTRACRGADRGPTQLTQW